MDSILSTDTDAPSFVILSHESLPPESVNSPRTSLQSNNWPYQSSTDLQQRLNQLVQVNTELKESLTQNNLAMKSQFDILAMWQDEVYKTHQSHKEKFAQTRDLVLKLREENNNLKKELSMCKQSDPASKIAVSDSFNSVIESLRQQLRAEEQRSKLMEADKLILVKERDSFREECTRLNIKITSLENVIQQRTEEVISLRMNQQMSLGTSPRLSEGSLRNGRMEESIPIRGESWVNLNEASMEPMTLVSVPSLVVKNGIEAWKEETEKAYKELSGRYNSLEADHANTTSELRNVLEKSKELQSNLSEKTELLKAALKELEEGRERIHQLEEEFSRIELLEAQVETNKLDYEAERRDREKLANDKAELEQQVRELRRRLEESGSSSSEPVESPQVNRQGTQAEAEQEIRCPVCKGVFLSEQDCLQHIDGCLENETLRSRRT